MSKLPCKENCILLPVCISKSDLRCDKFIRYLDSIIKENNIESRKEMRQIFKNVITASSEDFCCNYVIDNFKIIKYTALRGILRNIRMYGGK